MANKKNKIYVKKRKNASNQYTCNKRTKTDKTDQLMQNNDTATPEDENLNLSSSATKLDTSLRSISTAENNTDDFFFFINFGILKSLIEGIACCPSCNSRLLILTHGDRKGFSLKLHIECEACAWSTSSFTSPQFKFGKEKDNRGQKSFEVNARTVIAFREIGKGHQAMKTFTTMMNMPPPFVNTTYNSWINQLHDIYIETAQESTINAANEVRDKHLDSPNNDETVDCQVSIDGSWQKRGHASMNGVVTAIARDNGKVIDYQAFSKFCRGCLIWDRKKGTPEYQKWKETHVCHSNHSQSAGAMESVGAVNMFNSSIERFNLRYSHYIGDGDTGSFKKVIDSKPYGDDLVPVKLECVGHVQKRLGTRLRNLRTKLKAKDLSDGKKIQGKGRLTDKIVNKMQNYFGIAIRNNSAIAWDNDRDKALYAMKKGVLAVLWHCTDFSETADRHKFCPRQPDSWCKYWHAGKNDTSSVNLPLAIHRVIRPIFMDLRDDNLLNRCLDGTTQNPNEAVNQIIWKKCPKDTFVSKPVLDIGVASAVIQFNDGLSGFQKLFQRLNLSVGTYTKAGAIEIDTRRIGNMEVKSRKETMLARKKLRAIKKGHVDKEKQSEGGDSYVTGNF